MHGIYLGVGGPPLDYRTRSENEINQSVHIVNAYPAISAMRLAIRFAADLTGSLARCA